MFLHWQSKYVSKMLQKLIKYYDCTEGFYFRFLHSYLCVPPKNYCFDKMVGELFNPFFCQCWVIYFKISFFSSSKEIILNSGTAMSSLGINLYLFQWKNITNEDSESSFIYSGLSQLCSAASLKTSLISLAESWLYCSGLWC